MSKKTVQFIEMVRQEYVQLLIGELERQEILTNILGAELDGEITHEQAEELRNYYGKP